MDSKRLRMNEVLQFLSCSRTCVEISEHFGVPPEKVIRYLEKRRRLRDRNLFVYRDTTGENVYIYDKGDVDNLIVKSRLWVYRKHPDQPYLWIQFPDNLKYRKIVLAPIADAHYGHHAHMSKEFDRYLEWIRETENVFGFLNGDEIENVHTDSPPGAIYEQEIRPRDQLIQLREKLRPLAHKILWGHPGNHEGRSMKKTDLDPLWVICDALGIPYFDEPVYVDILWKTNRFTFFCQHGSSGAMTKGGKLNRANIPLTFQEHVMFNIMAHVHDPMVDEEPRICRERIFGKDGRLVSFRLVGKKQYTIICPAFLEYFGTYGARKGYPPPNYGIMTCEMYPNGDYHATS